MICQEAWERATYFMLSQGNKGEIRLPRFMENKNKFWSRVFQSVSKRAGKLKDKGWDIRQSYNLDIPRSRS